MRVVDVVTIAAIAVTVGTNGARRCAAEPVSGFYIGGAAGYGLVQDTDVTTAGAGGGRQHLRQDGGPAAVAAIGLGLGNGVRVELEGAYRRNAQRQGVGGGGASWRAGGMANLLLDFDVEEPWITPYIGVGVGAQAISWQGIRLPGGPFSGTRAAFAYQAMAGAAFPVSSVPGLSVTAEYRFLGLASGRRAPASAAGRIGGEANHDIMVGLRYAFAGPLGVQPERPPLVADPIQASRTYLVFFDWNRADLNPRARDIVAEAVRNTARVEHTRIEVAGHADRSGDSRANIGLSLRRARAVAAEMIAWGLPESAMDVHGFGDTRPLVPTAAGVREPQNRRVEIVYR